MAREPATWMPALTMLAVLGASVNSHAQELRPDVISNGVRIGAGTGAAAGAVLGLANEEICSPGTCAYLGAVTGGLIGLLLDKKNGDPRPVIPGSAVDDRLWNGALIGALSGVGIGLLEASVRCRSNPCTRGGMVRDVYLTARWMALVGLLVDAAIPSRMEGPGGVGASRSQRRLAVRLHLQF